MTPTVTIGDAQLYHADCRDVLRSLADNCIDSAVTDPPYALVSIVKRFGSKNAAPAKDGDVYARASVGFMGKTWDTGEVAFATEFWAEVLRVLKPGGHIVAFSGTRTYHRMVVAIEDAGFEIRDQLGWLYGSGFPKSHSMRDIGRPELGTALKPAWEPIVLARKPLIGTVAENVLQWGTGALNIDGCRVESEKPIRENTEGGEGMFRLGSRVAVETSSEGRWPANIVHDGSDEVVAAFPDAPGQQGDLASDNPRPSKTCFGDMAAPLPHRARIDETKSAARFFYCAKASKKDREEGLDQSAATIAHSADTRDGGRASLPRANTHPTVKPTSLMQWLCRLVTPPGGVVLDPFMGSGSTGKAALLEGFRFIGCEREDEYMPIAEARIRHVLRPIAAVAHPAAKTAANDNVSVQPDLFSAAA